MKTGIFLALLLQPFVPIVAASGSDLAHGWNLPRSSMAKRFAAPFQLKPALARLIVQSIFLSSLVSTSVSEQPPIGSPKPPQSAPVWDHTPEQIIQIAQDAIGASRKALDVIGKLPEAGCTFDSVVIPLAQDESMVYQSNLGFYESVSPTEGIRTAAAQASKLLSDYELEVSARPDIYKALRAVEKNSNLASLDPESQRLFQSLVRDRVREGLDLSENDQQKLRQLKKELNDLSNTFNKNLDEETGKVWFTPEELKGVPQHVLSRYEKAADGKLAMTFKEADFNPVIRFAISPETRKRASIANDHKAEANVAILDRIIVIRYEIALLLGRPDWMSFELDTMMIKNKTTVTQFHAIFESKLKAVGEEERKTLREIKQQELSQMNTLGDPLGYYSWDVEYYGRLFEEKTLALNLGLVQEYFPVAHVVNVILETYQSLLSVRLFQVTNPKTWSPSVSQWAVWDSDAISSGKATGGLGFLGYLHLDLERRPNKSGYTTVYGLIPGYQKADGSRQYPVSAVVANLFQETPEKPSLLAFDAVVTFFHELAHAFHQLCSETRYARLHGTAVARDFVDIPSRVLENLCWTESQIQKMSQHYIRQDEKMPKALIDQLIASRDLNPGLSSLGKLFYGFFDIHIHSSRRVTRDLTLTWAKMRQRIALINYPDDNVSPGQATFRAMVGGYAGYYYSYLYSEVIAADIFATVFASDPAAPATGKLFRQEILKPGASRDEMESLTKLLGREPNYQPFLDRVTSSSQRSRAIQKSG